MILTVLITAISAARTTTTAATTTFLADCSTSNNTVSVAIVYTGSLA